MTTQQLWQSQSAGALPVTLEDVRFRAARLSREAASKHWILIVICALLSAKLVWNLFHQFAGMPILQASTIYGCGFVWINLVHWLRRTKVAPLPTDSGVLGSFQFYGRELARQRDATKGIFVRYLLLPFPALVGLFASLILERNPVRWDAVWLMGIFSVLMLEHVAYSIWQRRRRFQKEIDALERLLR